MNIVPLEFSIVVVGQDCNPTILNPDFLKHRGIVPEEWGWQLAGAPITTPPFATVSYDSGLTVKVETNRFQVTDQSFADCVEKSKAIAIASKYIKVLPHVRYTGVGINFRSLLEMDKPDARLIESFLKKGPLQQDGNQLLGMTLKFVYPRDDARFTLSLEGAAMVRQHQETAKKITGVLASSNYHRECQGYPSDEYIIKFIDQAPADFDHYETVLRDLPLDR